MTANNKHTEFVKNHFETYASTGKWQSLYSKNINSNNFPFFLRIKWFEKIINKISPDNILDVGCGSGDFIPIIPTTISSYLGIDLSMSMIKSANIIIKEFPKNIQKKFQAHQTEFMSFNPKKKYDFILSSGFLEYFENLKEVCQKLYKLNNKNSYLAIQVPNREFYRWKGISLEKKSDKGFAHYRISKEECDEILKSVGYKKISGEYINVFFFNYSHKFPRLHVLLNRLLNNLFSDNFLKRRSSMYCGLYKKNN